MSSPPAPPVHRATRAELPALAEALARAFADDPVHRHLFGDPVPHDRARRFFEVVLHWRVGGGDVWAATDGAAAAVWAPPGRWKVPLRSMLPRLPAMLGVFRARSWANLRFLQAIEAVHPSEAHWYLELIGTDPAHQGEGHGSALITPVLARCDDEGLGAYLESSKEANLAYYARFGFSVVDELRPAGAVPIWTMWREPRPR